MGLRFPHLTYPLRPQGRRGIVRFVAALTLTLIAHSAFADPALWVVKNARSTVYLFGTIHLLKSDTVWETPAIANAFAGSSELWVEVENEDAPEVKTLVLQLGIDRAHPLSSKLAQADLARVDAAAKAAGMPGGEAALEPMRPWLAALNLITLPIIQAGFDPNKGVDKALKAEAAAAGKPVHAFETIEEQLRFFADLPQPVELQLLQSSLDDIAEGPAKVKSMVVAWSRGDIAALNKLFLELTERKYRDLYRVLIVNRNQAWADRIAERLRSSEGVTFVAVGAAHLAGADSLQRALEQRGIKSARVTAP